MFDAIVIGGSFAGLSAAMQLARGRRTVCVIDGGKPRNRFSAHSHGFFGRDGVPPLELIGEGRAHVAKYPKVEFVEGHAESAKKTADGFEVIVGHRTIAAKKLVLAFGVTDRLANIPGMEERWGKTVLPCPYCHGYEFGDQPLAVISFHPMSSHQAQLITEWGPTTFFSNEISLDDESRAKMLAKGIVIESAKVVGIEGEATVVLADGRKLPFTAIYTGGRVEMNSPIATQLGCEFDDGPFGPLVRTDPMKATTVPGVWAAGDITSMRPNATFASADGVMAGVSAHQSFVFAP